MTYQPVTRNGVDAAEPLDMNRPPRIGPLERQANITIEVGPGGLTVRCEYTGSLASIPAAIERLRTAGVLELVSPAATKPTAQSGGSTPPRKAAQPRETPVYNGAGEACCPKHNRVLKEGKFGLYCSAKDDSTERGYCSLKFSE